MYEASLYKKLKNEKVKCSLCNHFCLIDDGKRGACGVRENINGKLFSLNYGKLVALHVDPIEKKPLFHFLPGSRAYSISTVGCNFGCLFCQNWDISQSPKGGGFVDGEFIEPKEIVRLAKENDCKSIAYTYVEPTIFYEYARDVSVLAKKAGIKNVWVSNGYMSQDVLDDLIGNELMDAINVDLKSFSAKFYLTKCKAKIDPVKRNIKFLAKSSVWLEVTTLLIPDANDSESEIRSCADFLAGISKDIPWHVSAFYPAYKMLNSDPTPPDKLMKARDIGLNSGLKYVYIGNLPCLNAEDTSCPKCGEIFIKRSGYDVLKNDNCGKCRICGEIIKGFFD